jgi:hypothetical protein
MSVDAKERTSPSLIFNARISLKRSIHR